MEASVATMRAMSEQCKRQREYAWFHHPGRRRVWRRQPRGHNDAGVSRQSATRVWYSSSDRQAKQAARVAVQSPRVQVVQAAA
eukprot:4176663-Lingulodinium_polyedra.AAC.1